ncbi:hypothetical protein SAMN04487911_1016 [Arenibacter nanhaiticus]|uniref:Uncharacterized protein n=1 Tax=Arenibacter nanhaiticus TaxID=558155 RepID=A0A1M6A011_9FLAO|nr:hypothetical protein SAMN04487911_1016 [Arenibacter nanhaiticus]
MVVWATVGESFVGLPTENHGQWFGVHDGSKKNCIPDFFAVA